MTGWGVSPEGVSTILVSVQAQYDVMVGALFSTDPEKAAVPGGEAVLMWQTRVEDVAGAAGFDGVVASAFLGLVEDHVSLVVSAVNQFGTVLQATHDAAQALVNGDEVMAASVVAVAQEVLGGGG